jgi:hypothetical protein
MAEDRSPPEPGAPIPADAVDPELLRLPLPGLRRHPILAGAVVLLAAALLFRLWGDIQYGLIWGPPQPLGEARSALQAGLLRPGYVTLSGLPDHRSALLIEAKGERSRSELFRLLGTGSRVLVVTPGAFERASLSHTYTGRLRRLKDLPWAATIRDHYLEKVRNLRALDLTRLRALPAGPLPVPLTVPDRSGAPLSVQADEELIIHVLFPDDVRVLLLSSKFPSEPDARHEVERLGLPAGPGVATKDGFGYVLRLPPGPERHQALLRMDAQGFLFSRRVEIYRAPLRRVRTADAGLSVPGEGQPTRYVPDPQAPARLVPAPPALETLLPWQEIESVQISEPLRLPDDAYVLLEGETPARARYALGLAALLILFIGFNLWYLWRSLAKTQDAA